MMILQIETLTNTAIQLGERWGVAVMVLLIFAGFMGYLFWRALAYIVKLKDKFDARMREVDQAEAERAKTTQAYLEEQIERLQEIGQNRDALFADAIKENTAVLADLKSLMQRVMDKV